MAWGWWWGRWWWCGGGLCCCWWWWVWWIPGHCLSSYRSYHIRSYQIRAVLRATSQANQRLPSPAQPTTPATPQPHKTRKPPPPLHPASPPHTHTTHLEPEHQVPRLAPHLPTGVPLEALVQRLRLRRIAQGVEADGGLEGGEAADARLEGDHLTDLVFVGVGWGVRGDWIGWVEFGRACVCFFRARVLKGS